MRILFVCTGNICRSPTAEAVLRRMAEQAGLAVETESAATHDFHRGKPPDPRAQAAAAARGYDLSRLRARQVTPQDLHDFDLVVAMDRRHHRILADEVAPPGTAHKIRLFLSFADLGVTEVPDPYHHGPAAFERALDLIEAGVRGLIEHLTRPA